jgi:hypothetical protein
MVFVGHSPPRVTLTLGIHADVSETEAKAQHKYWETVVPVLQALVAELLQARPPEPGHLMIDWLSKAYKDKKEFDVDGAQRLFQALDVDGSGYVDKLELREVFVSCGMAEQDSTQLFNEINANNDNVICQDELINWLFPQMCTGGTAKKSSDLGDTMREKMLEAIARTAGQSVLNFMHELSHIEDAGVDHEICRCGHRFLREDSVFCRHCGAKRPARVVKEMRAQVAESQTVDPAPAWRAVTWNAAAEVTKLEFLPMTNSFIDAMERIAGAVILRHRGVKTWASACTNWGRYAPGAPGMPDEEALAPLIALTNDDILQGIDASRLASRWSRWGDQNPHGDACINEHLDTWRREKLCTLFQVAMAVREEEDIDPNEKVIPAFAINYQSVISRPDMTFSKREYQLRGPRWVEFLQDAANISGFSTTDFWNKWIDRFPDKYYTKDKKKEEKPLQFDPGEPDADYGAVAVWDGFLFHVARRIFELEPTFGQTESFWTKLRGDVEIPRERLIESSQSVVDWAISTGANILFLQEGNNLKAPSDWKVFPRPGAATAVWVPERLVDMELSEKAHLALDTLRSTFSGAIETCHGLEETVHKAGIAAMQSTAAYELDKLKLPLQLDKTCRHMVNAWPEYLEKLFQSIGNAPSSDQMKRMVKWFSDEKMAVAVIRLDGVPLLVVSAHAESGGTTCCSALIVAHALRGELQEEMDQSMRIVLGMDSNVKEGNTGAAADPAQLRRAANFLSFRTPEQESLLFAGTDTSADHTVLKTRGFLQPQMKGKAGVPDRNHKDWIFYLPAHDDGPEPAAPVLHGTVVNQVVNNEPGYCPGEMPRGCDFPSDHAVVIVTSTPT